MTNPKSPPETVSPEPEFLDPFDAHFHREPMTAAAVQVIQLAPPGLLAPSEVVAASLLALLIEQGREVQAIVVEPHEKGLAQTIEQALLEVEAPLILISSATSPWSAHHLAPLLDAINRCDHVIGRRRIGWLPLLARRLASLPWRWLFAVPVLDIHSPCTLHRLDKLALIPLQSSSSFLDVELLAKATFLGHLLDEISIPDLATARANTAWSDFLKVFKHPTFTRSPSAPAEDPQRQQEGDHCPGDENGHGRSHGQPTSPLQHHGPQGIQELSERQSLDEPLSPVRESL